MISMGSKGIKNHFGHMKTINQFIKNRQFFKTTLERDHQEKCDLVHTRYQVSGKLLLLKVLEDRARKGD